MPPISTKRLHHIVEKAKKNIEEDFYQYEINFVNRCYHLYSQFFLDYKIADLFNYHFLKARELRKELNDQKIFVYRIFLINNSFEFLYDQSDFDELVKLNKLSNQYINMLINYGNIFDDILTNSLDVKSWNVN